MFPKFGQEKRRYDPQMKNNSQKRLLNLLLVVFASTHMAVADNEPKGAEDQANENQDWRKECVVKAGYFKEEELARKEFTVLGANEAELKTKEYEIRTPSGSIFNETLDFSASMDETATKFGNVGSLVVTVNRTYRNVATGEEDSDEVFKISLATQMLNDNWSDSDLMAQKISAIEEIKFLVEGLGVVHVSCQDKVGQ